MKNFFKNFVEYIFFVFFIFFIRIMPLYVMRRVVVFLSFILFKVFGVRKKTALDNLYYAFPEKTEQERKRIAYESFKNFFLTIMELMWIPNLSQKRLLKMIKVENKEELDKFMLQQKGKIILTAHFGNWEYLAQYLAIEYKVNYPAIVKRMRNIFVDNYVNKCRNRFNYIHVLYMDKNVKEVFKALLSNKPLILLADQSAPQESIYIKFFNRYATTFQGPAVFSLRCHVPIRFILAVRERDFSYKIVHQEIPVSDIADTSDSSIYELSRRHVELLEKYIREYPEQWLWSHRRWKHSDKYEIFGKKNGI